jgi:hypothetical protein
LIHFSFFFLIGITPSLVTHFRNVTYCFNKFTLLILYLVTNLKINDFTSIIGYFYDFSRAILREKQPLKFFFNRKNMRKLFFNQLLFHFINSILVHSALFFHLILSFSILSSSFLSYPLLFYLILFFSILSSSIIPFHILSTISHVHTVHLLPCVHTFPHSVRTCVPSYCTYIRSLRTYQRTGVHA